MYPVRDRAAVVTPTLLRIFAAAFRRWHAGDQGALTDMRAEIESTLRDEFHDVARQTLNDIRIDD
jgi:hypothetical protein